ncbi:acyl carrier protein [Paraburkholderia azotifigens]|uniref:acyl carrier protein n=1 Tax=Paraburkholderia azotifigens TaxID=2057004 RepID=UPI0031714851
MNLLGRREIAQLRANRPLRNQVDLDSIDRLNFLLGPHGRLNVDIPESDYGRLATLDDVIAYLIKKRNAAPAGTPP